VKSTSSRRFAFTALAAPLCVAAVAGDARAQAYREETPPMPNTPAMELKGVDIVEHLGGALPRDAAFRDTAGNAVHLGDYFDGKRPTLFVFAYHTCPMLCSLVLDATVRTLNQVPWTVGQEFDVVSVSIDPNDTPETATRKRAQVIASYPRAAGSNVGWHFLVGDEANIRKVTDAVGFQYRYDERQKQYAHPAAIYLLTPEGHMARYLYGIEYPPNDVRLGLIEAAEGRSVSTTDRILLYCYHYDPQGKHYSIVAMNVMRLGGVVTLGVLGTFLTIMWARERVRRKPGAPRLGNANANLREPPNTSAV
jgi:protein SCO1/2